MSTGKIVIVQAPPMVPMVSGSTSAGSTLGTQLAAALPYAAGAAAVVGAVLLTRAALSAVSAAEARARREQVLRRADAEHENVWQYAYADLLEWRARVGHARSLAAQVGSAAPLAPLPDLPPDLDATRSTAAQIHAWCARAETALSTALPQLSRLRTEATATSLAARNQGDGYRRAVDLLLAAPASAAPAAAAVGSAAATRRTIEERVAVVLGGVGAVPEEEAARVVAQAARVLEQTDPDRAEAALTLLNQHARQALGRHEARERDRAAAARHLAALGADVEPGPGVPEVDAGLLAELRAARDGERPLDERLEAWVDDAFAERERQATVADRMTALAAAAESAGLLVEVTAGEPAGLTATLPGWGGEHVALTLRGERLHADLLPAAGGSIAPDLVDDWRQAHADVVRNLAGSGLRVGPTVEAGPEVPVTAEDEYWDLHVEPAAERGRKA